MNVRSRKWCYTLNNYTEAELDLVKAVECVYHVVGEEVGERGTPHLQGFVYFRCQKTMSAVKKILSARCHLERTKGTFAENKKYCEKDGKSWEKGELPADPAVKGLKEKEKWAEIVKMSKAGEVESICEKYPQVFFCHYRKMKRIQADYCAPLEDLGVLNNLWLYGATGTGKSKYARRLCRQEKVTMYSKGINKWFCGYKHEHTVLVEDVGDSHQFMAYFLKIWADHYSFRAQTKGGSMMIRPKRIIITSNYAIAECFPDERNWAPLERRFSVKRFDAVDFSRRKKRRIDDEDDSLMMDLDMEAELNMLP